MVWAVSAELRSISPPVTTMRAVSDVAPGVEAGVGEGLEDGAATWAVTNCALLLSAKISTANFFKIIFSWLQLEWTDEALHDRRRA